MMPVDAYFKYQQRVRIGVTVRDPFEATVDFPNGVDSNARAFITCAHCNTTFPTRKHKECPFCHKKT
jgi:hypothetical protein